MYIILPEVEVLAVATAVAAVELGISLHPRMDAMELEHKASLSSATPEPKRRYIL